MKNISIAAGKILLAVILGLNSLLGSTQAPDHSNSIFDLMNHREVLDLTLESDFTALKTNRHDESSHRASLHFKDANGHKQAWNLKVKLRGRYRRIKCSDIPPLRLDFKKSDLETAGLAPFNDLKLVPQCMDDGPRAEETLLREYLAYKLFNEVSPYSFRVQLVRITYKDTATGKKDKQWAFLIEDAAQLRERIGAEKVDERFNMPTDSFHLAQARIVALFEYMVGNTDWGLTNAKNVKFFLKKGKILAVPYDFDFSAVVSAPYAVPNSNVGQRNLHERIYLGLVEDPSNLTGTAQHLAAKRNHLQRTVLGFQHLDYEVRQDIVDYLATFFDNPLDIKMPNSLAQTPGIEPEDR